MPKLPYRAPNHVTPGAADARVEPRVTPRTPEPARAAEVKAAESPRASVLGPTLKFRGELSAQEDLIVQGSVEGSITHTQSLTIGTDGSMKGDIRARVIVIDGKVDGDLYATESVSIRATAKVKGNVFAPRVGISDGAFFQGTNRDAALGCGSAGAQCATASGGVEYVGADGSCGGRTQAQRIVGSTVQGTKSSGSTQARFKLKPPVQVGPGRTSRHTDGAELRTRRHQFAGASHRLRSGGNTY